MVERAWGFYCTCKAACCVVFYLDGLNQKIVACRAVIN